MIEKNKYQRAIDIFKKYCPDEFGGGSGSGGEGGSVISPSLASLRLQKVQDYLYYTEFFDWDYSAAEAYFRTHNHNLGSCSSVRNGNYYGRNFDYYYNDSVEFVVRTLANKNRHASIGVAYGGSTLTKSFVEQFKWNDIYNMLPFFVVDGINDAGVVCNINLVPAGDKGVTTGTNPEASVSLSIHEFVRYVLDNADSAKDAVNKITQINWHAPTGLEAHFMIGDSGLTYVVEFVDNEVRILSDDTADDYDNIPNAPVMTNFYLTGFDGTTTTGFLEDGGISEDDTTLTAHAQGVERYDILVNGQSSIDSSASMRALIDSVKFTNAYDLDTDPFWYSEFTGNDFGEDLTIYENASAYDEPIEIVTEEYNHKQRDGKLWHTVHSTVYDIMNRSFSICTQENSSVSHTFSIGSGLPYDS